MKVKVALLQESRNESERDDSDSVDIFCSCLYVIEEADHAASQSVRSNRSKRQIHHLFRWRCIYCF